ncbi:MAG: hypothetical protein K2O58_03780 [Bacteroidales bacterium]|nr:hypothetical protein [Bacteroidales bacterium]MDE7127000.1 hypothetical protein [Bacteroidales bacterium]
MQNKLQELTDRLYNEGLSKGKQEGEAILGQARKDAEDIVAKARKEAEAILAAAAKEAEDLRTKVTGDLKMAASQSIAATKQDIESLIVAKMTEKEIKSALTSADFVKETITAVAKGFNAGEPADLEVLLPESLRNELEPFIENELSKALDRGISASFSKKISGGFTIAPKDGGYFISFTEETFKELISEYLRPATKKILFG